MYSVGLHTILKMLMNTRSVKSQMVRGSANSLLNVSHLVSQLIDSHTSIHLIKPCLMEVTES